MRILLAILAFLFVGPAFANNDLPRWAGPLQPPLTLLSTANESGFAGSFTYVQSSVSGASGVFSPQLTGGAQYGDVIFTSGGAASSLVAGAVLTIWFNKYDGTNYEVCSSSLARPPDAVIALPTSIASGISYWSSGLHKTPIPGVNFKVCVYNGTGATLYSSGNTLTLISPASAY